MPHLYRSGERVSELGGVVRGGPVMVMHRPDDVRIAQNLCTMVEGVHEAAHVLYGLLSGPKLPEVVIGRTVTDGPAYRDWREVEEFQTTDMAIALGATLEFGHDLWRMQGPADVQVALAVARPDAGSMLDIDLANPALVFHRGSLLATVASG